MAASSSDGTFPGADPPLRALVCSYRDLEEMMGESGVAVDSSDVTVTLICDPLFRAITGIVFDVGLL
jgi:hypothetical protein